MAAPFLDKRPSRQDPHPIIEGRDLARLIGVPADELQQLGRVSSFPFPSAQHSGSCRWS
jgi:hypothetical protein